MATPKRAAKSAKKRTLAPALHPTVVSAPEPPAPAPPPAFASPRAPTLDPSPEPAPAPFDAPAPEPSKQALANRRNAQLSTGPRTAEGKAIVSANRITHGIRSPRPVVTSTETQETWEVHRNTVVADLAPSGAVELALAERVALLFWRLGRLVDYESDAINDGQANATYDIRWAALASPELRDDLVSPEEGRFMARAAGPVQLLAKITGDLARKRERFARLERRVVFLEAFPGMPPSQVVPGPPARALIEEVRSYLPPSKTYAWEAPETWTAAAVRERLEAACEIGEWSTELTVKSILDDWRKDRDAALNEIVELTKDELRATGFIEQDDREMTRRRGLPGAQQAEMVQRYESHLDRALARALAQLHQIQDRRSARHVATQGRGREDAGWERERGRGGTATVIVGLVNRGGGSGGGRGGGGMGLNGGNGGLAIEDGREGAGQE